MNESIVIRIPADDDGYVSFTCPACAGHFKLGASDVNEHEDPDFYCPLCGLSNECGAFLTSDVMDVAQQYATNLAADIINRAMRDMERSSGGSKFLKFERGRDIPREQVSELRATPDLVEATFPCCDATAKVPVSAEAAVIYCPFCGQVRA